MSNEKAGQLHSKLICSNENEIAVSISVALLQHTHTLVAKFQIGGWLTRTEQTLVVRSDFKFSVDHGSRPSGKPLILENNGRLSSYGTIMEFKNFVKYQGKSEEIWKNEISVTVSVNSLLRL